MNEYMENEKSVLGKYFWMVINFINLSVGKYETQKKSPTKLFWESFWYMAARQNTQLWEKVWFFFCCL